MANSYRICDLKLAHQQVVAALSLDSNHDGVLDAQDVPRMREVATSLSIEPHMRALIDELVEAPKPALAPPRVQPRPPATTTSERIAVQLAQEFVARYDRRIWPAQEALELLKLIRDTCPEQSEARRVARIALDASDNWLRVQAALRFIAKMKA